MIIKNVKQLVLAGLLLLAVGTVCPAHTTTPPPSPQEQAQPPAPGQHAAPRWSPRRHGGPRNHRADHQLILRATSTFAFDFFAP